MPNLFLMDGSMYPSSACQNPTVTIITLAAGPPITSSSGCSLAS